MTRKMRQGRQEAEVEAAEVEVRRFSLAWTGSGSKSIRGTEDVDVWGQTEMGSTCTGRDREGQL